MSMHIEGPWLSTTGKKKGKIKYKSAAAKRAAEDLNASWETIKKKHISTDVAKKYNVPSFHGKMDKNIPDLSIPTDRNTTSHLKSHVTAGGLTSLVPSKVYTGTKVKGIATMHKSNAVPVFSDEEVIDIARMRR